MAVVTARTDPVQPRRLIRVVLRTEFRSFWLESALAGMSQHVRPEMRTPVPHTISIADLTAAGLRLRPVEAVTIAREVLLRAHRGDLPGIPSPTVLRFTSGGDIICEGLPIPEKRPSRPDAGGLPRRTPDHVPGPPRQRLAARRRGRLHAEGAGRPYGGGVHLVARWPPGRLPQP